MVKVLIRVFQQEGFNQFLWFLVSLTKSGRTLENIICRYKNFSDIGKYSKPHALFHYLCVNFKKMCQRNILRLNLTSILCSELYGHDWLQTRKYKTRELRDLFAEVREKSVKGI